MAKPSIFFPVDRLRSESFPFKLKPGCLDRVRAWAAEINCRSDEALATLRDEGVVIETAFLDSSAEGDFLIYYLRAADFARASEVIAQSTHPIDAFHRQFKQDCWAETRQLDLLIDLETER
jgi:hypothetical protein